MPGVERAGIGLRRPTILLLLLGLLMALPGVASAHPATEAWDGTYDLGLVEAITDVDEVEITRQSDNVEFVAQVPVAATSDMQFQRREGRQVWDGEVIEGSRDIVVMGGTATPGMSIIDITDPSAPDVLATVSCGGFHSDVGVWENYAVQVWDGSARPCSDDEPANIGDIDEAPGNEGARVYDITDPARPVLVAFFGRSHGIPAGVHNLTINGEEGLVYLNMAEFNSVDPPWGYIDLRKLDEMRADGQVGSAGDIDFPEAITIRSIRDWSPTALDGCHDSGLAPTRQLYACAGITASYIWDLADPRNPTEVAVIPNPAISIHHGARWTPDEQNLVLGDETGGVIVGTPEEVCAGGHVAGNPVGATWFYDASIPQAPRVTGAFSPTDTEGEYCTSHFYGFVADTDLMVAGWYDAGIEVVDYSAVADGLPGTLTSHAVFEPAQSGFFSAYAWHGHVYGSSFEYGADGNTEAIGRGLWIIAVDGIEDVEPLAVDEGNSWGRWGTPVPDDVEVGTLVAVGPDGMSPVEGHVELPTDLLAMGVVALGGLVAWPPRRRRRGPVR